MSNEKLAMLNPGMYTPLSQDFKNLRSNRALIESAAEIAVEELESGSEVADLSVIGEMVHESIESCVDLIVSRVRSLFRGTGVEIEYDGASGLLYRA